MTRATLSPGVQAWSRKSHAKRTAFDGIGHERSLPRTVSDRPGLDVKRAYAGRRVDAWLRHGRAAVLPSVPPSAFDKDRGNDMVEKNIRDFERLIETTYVPEGARFRKSMNRFRKDVQAFQKACITAAIAAPDSHKIFAAWLVEFAEKLGEIDREIGVTESGYRGIPAMPAAPPCADLN